MTSDFLWHVATTFLAAGATILVLKVDMGWIKKLLQEHIQQDEVRFGAVQNRIDNLRDGHS